MKKQILVVDDSESIREIISIALAEEGYGAILAENGRQGLMKLESGTKVHLIISDINMPEMDGIDFLIEIRKSETHKYLPVIMLTTESQVARKNEAKLQGATGWITKPFQKEKLVAIVKKVLG